VSNWREVSDVFWDVVLMMYSGSCRAYRDGDFANADGSFTIPGA
jgi:hypothetical protein